MANLTYTDVSNQTIPGTTTNDSINLTGTGSNDLIYGNQGDDTINTGFGGNTDSNNYTNTSVYGGNGNDSINGFGSGSAIYGNVGADSIYIGYDTDLVVSNSSLFGGQGNDFLTDEYAEGGTKNLLNGGVGADSIQTYGAFDTAIGGQGNDFIVANGNSTLIYGNMDTDSITINGTATTAFGGQGSDVVLSNAAGSLVYGNLDNDAITLIGGTSSAYGGQGNDVIDITGDNSDAAYGNIGNDTIRIEGNTNGKLFGGQGNDVLYSVSNALGTSMTGGAGNDTFVGGTTAAGDGGRTFTNDTAVAITDFVTGVDKVDFGQTVSSYSQINNKAVTDINSAAALAGVSGTQGAVTLVTGATQSYLFIGNTNTLSGFVLTNSALVAQTDLTVGTNAATAATPTPNGGVA